ncbi:hypothetical protein PG990_005191 [Apiospora arundinis]
MRDSAAVPSGLQTWVGNCPRDSWAALGALGVARGHIGGVVVHRQQRPAGRVDRGEQEPKQLADFPYLSESEMDL